MPQARRMSRPLLITFIIAEKAILFPFPPLFFSTRLQPPSSLRGTPTISENHPVEPSAPAIPDVPLLPDRENATLLMLTNSREIDGVVRVVGEVEERFNHKLNYPWIFLNDEPFSEVFQRYVVPVSLFLLS